MTTTNTTQEATMTTISAAEQDQFQQGQNVGRNMAPTQELFARVQGNLARAIAANQPLRVAYNRGICQGLGIAEKGA